MITIATATSLREDDFHRQTFLGRSLERLRRLGTDVCLIARFQNPRSIGLSECYNDALSRAAADEPILFVHDDVSLQDIYLEEKLRAALREFDVVGTAGGDPPPNAPGWYRPEWRPTGFVPHADRARPDSALRPGFMCYGPGPGCCRVIDGHLIISMPSRLSQAGVTFDHQFTYHHYDFAFCDRARSAGLRIGTWPIWAVHGSGGDYSSQEWRDSAARYLNQSRQS